ncbi:MAG: sporulation protein [Saprospiraceae bacterium]|jgi:hypothetical protein|nr:sporulation protein [Saprospiraceae bacterium]MBK6565557.1 sporulation protein [Saprospiraceae bacterium]MBK7523069.1 sporulation protein [Saprospiraceae bacterium]MBK8081912.1 sporulation protein [Saprospiraceae bacterium]MBK8370553.1 sporulation protein [Saprospiraceae bacterium]
MLGNIKKILGIEGVKADVIFQEDLRKEAGKLQGTVILTTLRESQVSAISIKVIEKYSRGRKSNLLVNEYVMGQLEINKHITIRKEEEKRIDFEVPFHFVQSEMDKWQEQNIFYKGLISLAKKVKGVKSEFYVWVEVKEVGTKLAPHVKKIIPFE